MKPKRFDISGDMAFTCLVFFIIAVGFGCSAFYFVLKTLVLLKILGS